MPVYMHRLKNYLLVNSEQVFVLIILTTIATTNYYIDYKITFINFYFLPVIIAGYFLGSRRSILGAVLCICLVTLYAILYPQTFKLPNSQLDIYVHILAWGSFLILAGAVVGKQHESLKTKIIHTQELYHQLVESDKNVAKARTSTILGLAKLAEYRDTDTGAHLERIREYVKILTLELSNHPKYQGYITNKYIEDIFQSSILHDIGKVGIPDRILLKKGKLTDSEYRIIKRHTIIGYNAIKSVESQVKGESFLTIGKEIAYFHHEKWDGSGYPKGLKGTKIPLSARIVALADVYDALTSKRPYKEALTHDAAKKIIIEGRSIHFDPDLVEAFIVHADEFDKIREQLQENGLSKYELLNQQDLNAPDNSLLNVQA
jgi:HD-GYP domain-containing protein (c-di-GMP phosphodiesterase class II)